MSKIMSIEEIISGFRNIASICSTIHFTSIALGSVLFALITLNCLWPQRHVNQHSSTTHNVSIQRQKDRRVQEEPEIKWNILKFSSCAAVLGFLYSVYKFVSNAETYLNDTYSLVKFTISWSAFMCYFFGFFGMSFVDTDEIAQHQRQLSTELTTTRSSRPNNVMKREKHPLQENIKHKDPTVTPCSFLCDSDTKKSTQETSLSQSVENLKVQSNAELANLVLTGKIKDHQLEKLLDPNRAVQIRRLVFESKLSALGRSGALNELPCAPSLDYTKIFGANCEIVVGYVPIPVGMVGPLTLNGKTVYIPMATTEGCLVASTNRGCKAITSGSGAISSLLRDGITRAPCLRMNSAKEAAELKLWVEIESNFIMLKNAFEKTTSFGKLLSAVPTVAGKNVYLRMTCFAGDAMGMNMISKGSLAVIDFLRLQFPTLQLIALSGNMCTDKKAAAMNWIEGRGKSVVVEATIPKHIVQSTLKTSVEAMVATNLNKNLIGSAMAGALGGFNAHAANMVTAIFIATGQDPAQNVESSNCITLMEKTGEGDLWISCTMPSIEVGTVGGGTSLPAQSACLEAIGCKGGGEIPGENAQQLAHVVAGATLAGELSLMAALASNTLVQAHMQHNRKK